MKTTARLFVLVLLSVCMLSACSTKKMSYEGPNLNIAVIGDLPDIDHENIKFQQISLETFANDSKKMAGQFDAYMITPSMFEKASDDTFLTAYQNATIPIVFFDSEKRHLPFVSDGITYDTAQSESFVNGAHTTVYMPSKNSEDVSYFYLEKDTNIDELYKDIFEKVAAM